MPCGAPVLHAQSVAVEHREREVEPAAVQGVVDPGPVEVEVRDVAGEEHAVARIEEVDVAIEDAGAELVVEPHLAIVVTAHELDDGPGRPDVRRRWVGAPPPAPYPRARPRSRERRRGRRGKARRIAAASESPRARAAAPRPVRGKPRAQAPPPNVPAGRRLPGPARSIRTPSGRPSTICLASPNSIIVLSRKKSSFSTPA